MLKDPPPAHNDATAAPSSQAGQTGQAALPAMTPHRVSDGPNEAARADAPGDAPGRDASAGKRRRVGRRRPSDQRSTAEWVTLAISSLIVGTLVALTSYFYLTGSTAPASMEVEPRLADTFQNGSRFAVPVVVRNQGGATGEDVKMRVTLTNPDRRQETAEWQIQFLSGGGVSHGVAVFGSDPRQGQLEAGIVSYLEP